MATAHKKVYEKYIEKLVKALPMDDVTFTTQLSSNSILPDNVDSHIQSLSTPFNKAEYFLKKVIKSSLDIDETTEFENLITVLEKCGYSHVERLANKMKADLEKELEEKPSTKSRRKRAKVTSKAGAKRAASISEPSPPVELIVHKDKITESTITLSWKEPNPSDVPIIGYEVEYKKSGEDFKKVEKSLTHEDLTCEVTGLAGHTEYEFRVAAINAAGRGPFTHVVAQFTKFDCAAAVDKLKRQLGALTKLNYDAIMGSLYAEDVITDNEIKIIDDKIGQQKMMYLIVDIIIPSLRLKHCKKYKGFLKAMEESDDSDLRSTAERFGGSMSVPES